MAASWQIGGDAHTHPFVLAGQRLAYPAANLGALAVLVLALLGLATLVVAIAATAREVAASVRFARGIDARAVHGDVRVIAEERPLAFCAGLWRPRVYVSSGAVELLDDAALQAVLAHERHHQRRRDPLRLAAGRVLERALFWFPGVPALVARQRAWAELGADERVVAEQPASRSALARAMLRFADHDGPGAAVDPARVDQLVGEPQRWRFPVLLCLGAALMAGLLVAVSTLLARVASGSASLAPPLLSAQPCVVTLALIPAVIVAAAAVALRR